MTSRVAEMARQAAAEVRTRGLAKGTLLDSKGRMCTSGLVCFVDEGASLGDLSRSGWDLWGACQSEIGYLPVSDWNDAPERTAEDVALMFERVAEQFESPTQPTVAIGPS